MRNIYLKLFEISKKTGLLSLGVFKYNIFLPLYFFYKRFKEDPFYSLARKYPDFFSNGNILDVGANIGYNTYVFSGIVKPPYKVYSFEPELENFSMLDNFLKLKKIKDKVEIFNLALSDFDGESKLLMSNSHNGNHRLVVENDRIESGKVKEVKVKKIDTFIKENNIEKISFIKIDVEGLEYFVCLGMKETLKNNPQAVIALEISKEDSNYKGYSYLNVFNFFKELDYGYFILQTKNNNCLLSQMDKIALNKHLNENGYTNVLFVKKEELISLYTYSFSE